MEGKVCNQKWGANGIRASRDARPPNRGRAKTFNQFEYLGLLQEIH